MILYTKDFKQVEFEERPIFDEGTCGYIYRYDDKVLKVYKDLCSFRYKLKRRNFNLLKKLDVPSLPKLDEFFFSFKMGSLFKERISAYTMNYIERNDFDILVCDKKFLYEMVYKLDYSIMKLSENDIVLYDIKRLNTILNDDGINLIDVDLYHKKDLFYMFYNSNVYNVNKALIIGLINQYIFYSAESRELPNAFDTLLFIKYDPNLTLTECVMNSLIEDNILNCIQSKLEKKKIR